ncbi:MAG: FecR family protein, partial [Anaerolineae bacterium]|nr:FecR family protein [Anaerolineae bacterium]
MDEIKKDNIADESVEPGQENNEPKDQAKPIFGRRRIQFALILVLLCAVLSYIWLLPDPGVPIPGAMISEIQGDVKVQQPGSDELLAAENGMTLQAGGLVFTGSDGRARIDIGDHVFSRLGPNSDFIFQSASLHKKGFYASFKLEVGEIWIILNGGSLDVDTPDGLASVRGSYMNVRVDPLTGTRVTCLEGHCQVITQGGSVRITTGEFAEITDSIYPPTPGCMTNGDVSIWLSVNPESTRTVPTVTSESPLCWGKYSGGVSPTSPNGPT